MMRSLNSNSFSLTLFYSNNYEILHYSEFNNRNIVVQVSMICRQTIICLLLLTLVKIDSIHKSELLECFAEHDNNMINKNEEKFEKKKREERQKGIGKNIFLPYFLLFFLLVQKWFILVTHHRSDISVQDEIKTIFEQMKISDRNLVVEKKIRILTLNTTKKSFANLCE